MKSRGMGRKTWGECVIDDIKLNSLQLVWAIFRDMWKDFILGKCITLVKHGRNGRFQNKG